MLNNILLTYSLNKFMFMIWLKSTIHSLVEKKDAVRMLIKEI